MIIFRSTLKIELLVPSKECASNFNAVQPGIHFLKSPFSAVTFLRLILIKHAVNTNAWVWALPPAFRNLLFKPNCIGLKWKNKKTYKLYRWKRILFEHSKDWMDFVLLAYNIISLLVHGNYCIPLCCNFASVHSERMRPVSDCIYMSILLWSGFWSITFFPKPGFGLILVLREQILLPRVLPWHVYTLHWFDS